MQWGKLSTKAEFDESLHPRDEDGRFTQSSHGSTSTTMPKGHQIHKDVFGKVRSVTDSKGKVIYNPNLEELRRTKDILGDKTEFTGPYADKPVRPATMKEAVIERKKKIATVMRVVRNVAALGVSAVAVKKIWDGVKYVSDKLNSSQEITQKWDGLLSKADWDESLHPRESDGRFTNSGGSNDPQLVNDFKPGELIHKPRYPKNTMKNKPFNSRPDTRPIMAKEEAEGLKREIAYLNSVKPNLKYRKLGEFQKVVGKLNTKLALGKFLPAQLLAYGLVSEFSKKIAPYFNMDNNTQKSENAMKWGRLLTKADWEESKHPRSGDGKFASSSGGTVSQVENPRKRVGVDTWAYGKLGEIKKQQDILRGVEKLGKGMISKKKTNAVKFLAGSVLALGASVLAVKTAWGMIKNKTEELEVPMETKKHDPMSVLIETIRPLGPITARKLQEKAEGSTLEAYVKEGNAPAIKKLVDILKMSLEDRKKWFESQTDEEAQKFVAEVMAEYEEIQAEKMDQERWPKGTPGGLGGRWKDMGKGKGTGGSGSLRGTKATEPTETKRSRGRPSKEESVAKNREKIRSMGKRDLLKALILPAIGAALSQFGEGLYEVAMAHIDGWMEQGKNKATEYAKEKATTILTPKETPAPEPKPKNPVGRPRTKPVEEKEKRPVGRPRKDTEKEDNTMPWGRLSTKTESDGEKNLKNSEKANKGPHFRNTKGQFAHIWGNAPKPTWRDSYMQTQEGYRMNPPTLMTGSFMNSEGEGEGSE